MTAVYLARRGRGAAVLSTALNSNAINVLAGLLIPASLAGLGPRSGQSTLVAAWYAGLTVLALALAYRGRGLGRMSGAAIIAGYLAFVIALVISVAQGGVRPATAALPGRYRRCGRLLAADLADAVAAGRAHGDQRPGRPVAQGIPASRMEHRPPVEAQPHPDRHDRGLRCGQRTTPHPDRGAYRRPVCAVLTARWALTATTTGFALVLGVLLGVPDQIFATITQYALLSRRRGRRRGRHRRRRGLAAPAIPEPGRWPGAVAAGTSGSLGANCSRRNRAGRAPRWPCPA